MLEEEIKRANNFLISSVREDMSAWLSAQVTDDQILEVPLQGEYSAFLQGWLEGQGYNTLETDLTREANVHKR